MLLPPEQAPVCLFWGARPPRPAKPITTLRVPPLGMNVPTLVCRSLCVMCCIVPSFVVVPLLPVLGSADLQASFFFCLFFFFYFLNKEEMRCLCLYPRLFTLLDTFLVSTQRSAKVRRSVYLSGSPSTSPEMKVPAPRTEPAHLSPPLTKLWPHGLGSGPQVCRAGSCSGLCTHHSLCLELAPCSLHTGFFRLALSSASPMSPSCSRLHRASLLECIFLLYLPRCTYQFRKSSFFGLISFT